MISLGVIYAWSGENKNQFMRKLQVQSQWLYRSKLQLVGKFPSNRAVSHGRGQDFICDTKKNFLSNWLVLWRIRSLATFFFYFPSNIVGSLSYTEYCSLLPDHDSMALLWRRLSLKRRAKVETPFGIKNGIATKHFWCVLSRPVTL